MSSVQSGLLGCDNLWLASSVQRLLLSTGRLSVVHICSLAQIRLSAAQTAPNLIIILVGGSLLMHEAELIRLRNEQPAARIVLTIPASSDVYKSHPGMARFDALLDESQLGQELLPTIERLIGQR